MRLALLLLAVPSLALAQAPASNRSAAGAGHLPRTPRVPLAANDAVNAADIQKNADWLEQAFRKRGFTTKQLENMGTTPATF
jgi:hypothetical protein